MKMSTSKRILNWDLSAGKPEPLIEAEAVIALFYHMQRVAPQVWSDLITQASSATTEEDLEKAVAAWAVKWWLCGPAGPTEWALLIGVATAKAVLSVPAIQLPPNVDIFICICADPRSSLTHRRIVSARRLLVGIDAARSMFFASTPTPIRCQQPGAAPGCIPIPIFRESFSDNRSWFLFSRWCFTLYRRSIRNKFAALKGGHTVATRPLGLGCDPGWAAQALWWGFPEHRQREGLADSTGRGIAPPAAAPSDSGRCHRCGSCVSQSPSEMLHGTAPWSFGKLPPAFPHGRSHLVRAIR